ncbi:unnamed protein product [Urochloa decumbens]|uniref:Laccase n=1 Tax=Urochloa decumbens TaxID=240449 RepID=A0ABC9HBK6_9POAL
MQASGMSSPSSMSSSSLLLMTLQLGLLLCSSLLQLAVAKEQYHEFVVQEASVTRLCQNRSIMTVNGQFPGPAVEISEGDSLIVRVMNRGRYNVTVHWHGVRQMRTGWADGPEYVTQCPIRPGGSYTYRFTVGGQEGTLWWHAHSSWLRATVYGALIIRPRSGVTAYPFFETPAREIPILLGEWWDMNPIDVVRTATRTGAAPNVSDALTVNGQPGDLYGSCSSKDTATFAVRSGETSLVRFINAALNTELFVSIAGHSMTVVGADASYTKPYSTTVLMIAPGQTTDVLVTFDQPPGKYYLAARAYASAQGVPFDNTTTTAIFQYDGGAGSSPSMPTLPAYNDTAAATAFTTSLRGLRRAELPSQVDESLFFTVGVGLFNCSSGETCGGPNNTRFAASINNVSFVLPSTVSILQAHYSQQSEQQAVFTADFPANPPVEFDYTAQNVSRALWQPVPGTKVYKLKYGAGVQVVLQGTNIFAGENHPIHIHGYDLYILAQGFGNFDAAKDGLLFNLDDPPMRNTVAVPVNGWAVIRFVADNPGVWLMLWQNRLN